MKLKYFNIIGIFLICIYLKLTINMDISAYFIIGMIFLILLNVIILAEVESKRVFEHSHHFLIAPKQKKYLLKDFNLCIYTYINLGYRKRGPSKVEEKLYKIDENNIDMVIENILDRIKITEELSLSLYDINYNTHLFTFIFNKNFCNNKENLIKYYKKDIEKLLNDFFNNKYVYVESNYVKSKYLRFLKYKEVTLHFSNQ